MGVVERDEFSQAVLADLECLAVFCDDHGVFATLSVVVAVIAKWFRV